MPNRKPLNFARRLEELEYAAREVARDAATLAGRLDAQRFADELAKLRTLAKETNRAAYGD